MDNVIGHGNWIENLIQRVRLLVSFGLSVEEILDNCADVPAGEVLLAWHAAKILDKETPK